VASGSEVPDVSGEKVAIGAGIGSLLECAFYLQIDAAKRLDHSYSALLCRRINLLRRSDPVLPVLRCSKNLAQQNRNRNSEYLPQRRQGRKGRIKMSFRPKGENFLRSLASAQDDGLRPSLSAFAPWREKYPNPMVLESRIIYASFANCELLQCNVRKKNSIL
jgi:hypothetical protein